MINFNCFGFFNFSLLCFVMVAFLSGVMLLLASLNDLKTQNEKKIGIRVSLFQCVIY